MTFPHLKDSITEKPRPLGDVASGIGAKLRAYPSRPASLLGGKYIVTRPAGYTDEEWKDALVDARRLGYL